MNDHMSLLATDFDKQVFLSEFWQQKPCLISAAANTTGYAPTDWLSADELAGLACEPDMESRLVLTKTNNNPWQVLHGPFSPADFANLPDQPYNLLVQAVDQCIPSLRQIWESFDFLPHWRIDDVMVNASSDGGSVGPHFDFYDVFLIQGSGQKRWQTGESCDSSTPLDTSSGLKLLTRFSPQQEWLLNPGDILYVPAGVAHHGIAVGDSMTYSLGFRAPAYQEMVMGVAELIAEKLPDEKRYRDADATLPMHPAEIPESVIQVLQAELLKLANNTDAIRQWFGETMTHPRDEFADDFANDGSDNLDLNTVLDTILNDATGSARIWRRPGARFAYQLEGDSLWLFADGQTYQTNPDLLVFIQDLCSSDWDTPISPEWIHAASQQALLKQLIGTLCQSGTLYWDVHE